MHNNSDAFQGQNKGTSSILDFIGWNELVLSGHPPLLRVYLERAVLVDQGALVIVAGAQLVLRPYGRLEGGIHQLVHLIHSTVQCRPEQLQNNPPARDTPSGSPPRPRSVRARESPRRTGRAWRDPPARPAGPLRPARPAASAARCSLSVAASPPCRRGTRNRTSSVRSARPASSTDP